MVTISPASNVLSVLAQVSTSAAQLAVTSENGHIAADIQDRLNTQIAALQPASDSASGNALDSQITGLQTQQSAIEALSPKYGANANFLAGLQTQLSQLQTDASNGNSADFDNTLTAANTYLNDLTAITAPAPFQADGVAGLQEAGLGIANSSAYDLSTPSGQTEAAAAVTAAQNAVSNVFSITTANQLLASDLSNALSTQITQLNSLQQQEQSSSQSSSNAEIQRLTQQAHDQEHVIELALGNTTELANSLFTSTEPTTSPTSPLEVLENMVGATAASSTAASNSSPPILSLLA
jgi:hypothetical protein